MTSPSRVAIRAAVLTVSDRCSRGEAVDTSGPAVAQMLQSRLGAEIRFTRCIPDEGSVLIETFREWSREGCGIDLIASTGGTGLSPRDVTPEAALKVIDRAHPGLMELARLRCLAKTPLSYLSRGVAGAACQTLIITLPGSPRGATETLEAMLDLLPHAIDSLRGDVRPDDHHRRH
jgi:molybdenum cofactor synthesis domain-containing protein